MKKIILSAVVLLCLSFSVVNTVYEYSIVQSDGNEMPLSAYAGKNIMISILPAIQNDSNLAILQNLDTIQRIYTDSLVMIGIPSYEDGFEDDSTESVMNWYHNVFDTSFITAQGMNTRRASPYQSALFKWLTRAAENGHFDDDAMGAGETYFINKEGLLIGVAMPGTPLTSDIVNGILNQ